MVPTGPMAMQGSSIYFMELGVRCRRESFMRQALVLPANRAHGTAGRQDSNGRA